MSQASTFNAPRAAIVTGASGGLGRAFAVELARLGTPVTVVARREAELRDTARLVRSEGVASAVVVGDVCEPGLADTAVAVTTSELGEVDLLVNNAGVMFIGSVEDSDPAGWWQCVTTNVRGPMLWARAVLPAMRARGRGRIINVSSVGAFTQHPYGSAYCASKAAINQLTSCLSAEVSDCGVAVLSFGPEALTDMSRQLFESSEMPAALRAIYGDYFKTAAADEMLRHSLELFRFIAVGGADDLTGQYVGTQLNGFDTPSGVAERATKASP